MTKSEAERVEAHLRDILERHVGAVITPELATGMLMVAKSTITSMVPVEVTKKPTPQRKKAV